MPRTEAEAARAGSSPESADGLTTFSVIKPAASLLEAAGAQGQASSRLQMLNEVHRALAAPVSARRCSR